MPDFGIFRGFNEKLFGDKLVAGQLPTQLGLIGSESLGFLGLLDDYPNAAAAYSLRQLRNAYTGDAIRVRRSSDNTEQDIGFVNNELDTSTLTSFCSGTDGFVKTWYDQSGNGNNATQTTAANQPQIVSSGSVILENGKPSVQFDGSNDVLFSPTFTAISQPATHFSVTKITTNSSNIFDGESQDRFTVNKGAVNTVLIYAGTALSTSNYITSSLNYIYALFNIASSQLQVNNNSIVSGNVGSNTVNRLSIGASGIGLYASTGNISEYILYPSDQSSNRTGIQTNINDFYSIY